MHVGNINIGNVIMKKQLTANTKQVISQTSHAASQNANAASSLIRIIAVVIGLIILGTSRYAFIFYSAAMIPSVISVFVDHHENRCSSATISTFNLIGVLPYIVNFWQNPTADVQDTIYNVKVWVVIYGTALVGLALYWAIPYLVARFYVIKSSVHSTLIAAERDRICADWGIKSDDPFRGILDEKSRTQIEKKLMD